MSPDLMYRYAGSLLVPSAQIAAESVENVSKMTGLTCSVICTDFIWISQDHNRLLQD